MYKSIIDNGNYFISLNGLVKDNRGVECTLPMVDNKVKITIYGKERLVDLKWLALISHYEVDLPEHLRDKLEYITFEEVPSNRLLRINSGHFMVLNTPFQYKKGFNLIPGFMRYAISRKGVMIDLKRPKQEIKITIPGTNDYPKIGVYNPDKSKAVSFPLHRLLAFTWIHRKSPGMWMVNHKDGVKSNFKLSNLEWVTPQENNKHAVSTGLDADAIMTVVRDTKDWKTHVFGSISEACRWMGCAVTSMVQLHAKLRPGRLLVNRFEVRVGDDKSPWYYKPGDKVRNGRYTITAKLSDTDIRTYYDTRDFRKELKLWNAPGIEAMFDKAKTFYPDGEFSYEDHYEARRIECYNLNTGEILVSDTIMWLSSRLNIYKSRIRSTLSQGLNREVDGYLFRYEVDEPWDLNYTKRKALNVCIQAEHQTTGEILVFDSFRHAATHFDVDRSVIRRRVNTDSLYQDWKFKEIHGPLDS